MEINETVMNNEAGTIRVLTVDDHPIFRQGLLSMLDAEDGIVPAGDVASLEEALDWLASHRADVVLLDNNLPGKTGVAGLEDLLRIQQDLQVVILTVCDDDELLLAAIDAGACGYILKDASPERLVEVIRAAAAGECRVSEKLTGKLFKRLNDKHAASTPAQGGKMQAQAVPAGKTQNLAPRDQQLLGLLAMGLSNKEIGQRMNLSPYTIRNQLHRLQQQFGARNRVQLVILAGVDSADPGNGTPSPA
jgi:DNA-binding NarL/FixJ family response regulator